MANAGYKYFLIILFSLFLSLGISAKTWDEKKFTIIIDAGHGGKDVGAIDNGVKEKDINLKVAKNLEAIIKKKMKNANVVMTRNSDTFLTLQQRAEKANQSHGDIFISIHTNSVAKSNKNRKNIEGASVYTLGLHKDEDNLDVAMRENAVIELEQDYQQKYSGFDPQRDESYIIFEMAQKQNLAQSIKFAEAVEKELIKAGRIDRGVHQAGFWVLWATSMPSVLVELDFICNPQSAQYMSSDKGSKELAEAIFKAVKSYEESWNKSRKGIQNDSSNTYSIDDDSPLEESYSIISNLSAAKAKTRIHKIDNRSKTVSTKRKRRSLASRQLSLNQSFEKNDLIFPDLKDFSTSSSSQLPDSQLVAMEDSSTKSKNKSKNKGKEEKKKGKEAKKKAEQEKKQRKQDAHNAKINKLVTVYKIQILASPDLLSNDSERFCGLTPVSTYKENNLYKYFYGESMDKSELESILPDIQKKIPDAFIVASTKTVQTKK